MEIKHQFDPEYETIPEWNNKKVYSYHLYNVQEQYKRLGLDFKDVELDLIETSKFNELNDELNNKETGILVVSGSEKNLAERLFYGSFVEKSIFKLDTNVLLVKNEIKENIKHIAVAIDMNKDDANLIFQAINAAKQLGASITLVHAMTLNSWEFYNEVLKHKNSLPTDATGHLGEKHKHAEKVLDELRKKVEDAGVECKEVVQVGYGEDYAQIINRYVTENPVDLMFIEPHKGILQSFHTGSTSFDLIKNTPVNFFIVKERFKVFLT
jgi:nucleotide-binding universal stress UspA family protein